MIITENKDIIDNRIVDGMWFVITEDSFFKDLVFRTEKEAVNAYNTKDLSTALDAEKTYK